MPNPKKEKVVSARGASTCCHEWSTLDSVENETSKHLLLSCDLCGTLVTTRLCLEETPGSESPVLGFINVN